MLRPSTTYTDPDALGVLNSSFICHLSTSEMENKAITTLTELRKLSAGTEVN